MHIRTSLAIIGIAMAVPFTSFAAMPQRGDGSGASSYMQKWLMQVRTHYMQPFVPVTSIPTGLTTRQRERMMGIPSTLTMPQPAMNATEWPDWIGIPSWIGR